LSGSGFSEINEFCPVKPIQPDVAETVLDQIKAILFGAACLFADVRHIGNMQFDKIGNCFDSQGAFACRYFPSVDVNFGAATPNFSVLFH
jgi:hypothetical protein